MFPHHKCLKNGSTLGVWLICAASITGLGIQGCQSTDAKPSNATASPSAPKVLGIFPAPPARAGAQLWAESCNRCHNAPPAERYSDAQWGVIVHHMRLRANLTGEEQRKITEFLQASN